MNVQGKFPHAVLVSLLLGAVILFCVVFAQPVPVKNSISTESLQEDQYQQAKNRLVGLVETKNPRVALAELTVLMKTDSSVNQSCHEFAHEIGHQAYKKYGSFGKAVLYQDDICGSGYLHGVIESAFKNTSDIDMQMNTICASYASANSSLKCYHGVGHGLMYYTDNDVSKSIAMCATYRNNEVKIACSEGVYMENFSTDLHDHSSSFLHVDNPSYPCTEQNTFYKGSCYFYAPIYYLQLHNNNYQSGMDWCETLESAFRVRCLNGMGSRAMKQNVYNREIAENVCKNAKPDQVAPCIDGLVSYYFVQTDSVKQVTEMCGDFNGVDQKSCLASINTRRRIYGN